MFLFDMSDHVALNVLFRSQENLNNDQTSNIVGERNGILDLKEDMIKILKNISTVSEDFRRID